MTDDNVIPMRSDRVIATVGGSVDELRVTLALYGDELDPDEITAALGCQPTSAHRRGETRIGKKTGLVTVYKQGAWLLSAEGRAPRTADEITSEVLARVSGDEAVWSDLAGRYDVQLRYGVFLEAWNRGFSLGRAVVQRAALLRASLEFDIYANIDSDTSEM
jgi:hypothetical protein